MKKNPLVLISLQLFFLILNSSSYAQNTFPLSGNVGIGTTNPINKLTITEASGANTYVNVSNNAVGTLFGVAGSSFGIIGTTSNHDFTIYTNLNEKLRVTNDGNVGVGTANPNAKLDVNGIIRYGNGTGSIGGLSYGSTGLITLEAVSANTSIALLPNGTGNVGIGTVAPDARLTVAGNIHSKEIKVSVDAGADFVFEDSYKPLTLKETEEFININKHLPDISPASKMVKEGINLSEMNIKLLQKIEELTLYLIEIEKKNNQDRLEQQQQIDQQQKDIKYLRSRLKQ